MHTLTPVITEEQTIISLYKSNIGTSSISKQLSIPYQRVRKVLIKNGIKFRTSSDYFILRYPASLIDTVIDLNLTHKKSPFEISKIMNLDEGVVNRMFKSRNIIPIRCKNNRHLDLNQEEKETIIKLFSNNHSILGTAKLIGRPESCVTKVLKEFNIYQPTVFTTYNTTYFDQIDTHEKAYVLGLLITDGCNTPDYGCVSLVLKDYEIVNKINSILATDRPVFYRNVDNSTYCGLSIHNQQICNRLVELGLPKAKTFKIKPQDWMVGEFCNSAILGMFDGDGSIYCRNVDRNNDLLPRKDWVFSFIGLSSICNMMQNIFLNKLGIVSGVAPHSRYKNNIEKPLCTIRVYGNRQVKVLFDWLYKDSPLRIDRKYNRYLELCNPVATKFVNQFG